MKTKYIFILVIGFALLVNPASAWGFEIFGHKVGVQEYKALGDKDERGFTIGNIAVESDMTIDKVDWYIDGSFDSSVKKVRKADFTFNPKGNRNLRGDITEYKAGKDRATGKHIHKITAMTSGGEQSWFVLS